MASIDRTAYPQLQSRLTAEEIHALFDPTTDEITFIQDHSRQPHTQLALMLLLKTGQRLGYFPLIADIPLAIQQFLCQQLDLSMTLLPIMEDERRRRRQLQYLRIRLQLQPYAGIGETVVRVAIKEAVKTMSDPADLINVALESLHTQRIELPAFSTINRTVLHFRHHAHSVMFNEVASQLTSEQRIVLDQLLQVGDKRRISDFTQLKQTPGAATLKEIDRWEKRLKWLRGVMDAQPFLEKITHTKRKEFAAHAHALELSDIRRIANANQRDTLLLCLLADAQTNTLDQLTTMLLKRMRLIHRNAKARMLQLREQYQTLYEQMVAAMDEIVQSAKGVSDDTLLGGRVRRILANYGGIDQLDAQTALLSAYHDNNYLPLIWDCYRWHRSLLFRLLSQLDMQSATQDTQLVDAVAFLGQYQTARRQYLPADIVLSFASQRWLQLVVTRSRNKTVYRRRELEVCIFHYVAVGLSRGDLFVVGSEQYADYRNQLLSWHEACEPQLAAYCQAVDLPATAVAFVTQLRRQLAQAAIKADNAFPNNSDLTIDADGKPHLAKMPKQPKPETLDQLRDLVKERMPERNLLDILKNVQHWVSYIHHFGPPSGSDTKLADPVEKYLVTIFGYGCGLGAAQTARHSGGLLSDRVMKRLNQQHFSIEKLESATRDIINEYARFKLPFIWGSGKRAVADGTHFRLIDNNLHGDYHFRYGEFGAIAYHHISDTYVALFTHFITCGVWEAVYILDGLLKNHSAIQPDTVHADTQGQSAVVFGLSYLLGIQLMPRMRNWNKVDLCRPSRATVYKHIDPLFNRVINWSLIETHWQDMMQVVLSIQAGKVLPSMLLQKLGSHNRHNKLYRAFSEVGRAVRTLFLLNYVSDLPLRLQIRQATTVVERFNDFLDWLDFGGDGVIRQRDPVVQEKYLKYMNLVANSIILHNVVDLTDLLHALYLEGYPLSSELISHLSPYLTQHIKRFGDYYVDMSNLPQPLRPDKPFLP